MKQSRGLILALIAISGIFAAHAQSSDKIQAVVTDAIAQGKIPGMVASDRVLAIGAAGVRKEGSKDAFTEKDVVHLGSDTKAMTSVLMATLAQDGILTWDTTIIEALPDLENRMHEDYHSVTIWELLTHHSGLPNGAKDWRDHDGTKIA